MKNATKKNITNNSIAATFILLRDILNSPSNYITNEIIKEALKTQGSLCSLELSFSVGNLEYHIKPMSLNTLKKNLDENNPTNNFSLLNKLRQQAKNTITNYSAAPSKTRPRTKAGLDTYNSELKEEIHSLHRINMVLLQALANNIKDFTTIERTPNTGLRQSRIQKAISRTLKILSLNPAPFDDVSNINRNHLQLVVNNNEE